MNRVIFVGIHNKPEMKPLDSRTRSGKTIDQIISKLNADCVKTNLYEVDYYPAVKEMSSLQWQWFKKYTPSSCDVVVLLGRSVQQDFFNCLAKKVKVPHPSLQFAKLSREQYIEKVVKEIEAALLTTNPQGE
jgi:hypothetical protein